MTKLKVSFRNFCEGAEIIIYLYLKIPGSNLTGRGRGRGRVVSACLGPLVISIACCRV